MPRGVSGDSPELDPVALWFGYEPGAVPSVTEPTHTYGDQGIGLDPGDDDEPQPDLPASTEDSQPSLQPPEVTHRLDGREDQDVAPPFEVEAIPGGWQPPPAGRVCGNGHDCPAGAKFCMECGDPFTVTAAPADWDCQNGHHNQAAAKFCMECGDQRPDLKAPVAGAGMAVELLSRPQPEEVLTPQQRALREAQHAEALRLGQADPGVRYQPPRSSNTVLFHVLKSGWTWAGQVWMRGQEIELDIGSPRWQEAQRFLGMTDEQQYETYGRVCFRKGPWPGRKSFADIEPGSYQPLAALDGKGRVTGPSTQALEEADRREQARRRGVPAPVFR